MSKLAHSNQATMDEIESWGDDEPDEGCCQSGPRISTSYFLAPIPLREFDWCAFYGGNEEGPRGWGCTEQEAIDDLLASGAAE